MRLCVLLNEMLQLNIILVSTKSVYICMGANLELGYAG